MSSLIQTKHSETSIVMTHILCIVYMVSLSLTLFVLLLSLFVIVIRYIGEVAFVGPVHYAEGEYVGAIIVDDSGAGKNNGEHITLSLTLLLHMMSTALLISVISFAITLIC